MADAEQVTDAAEAYIYGYPLVYDLKEVAGVPKPDPRVRDELQWWERFRAALAAFPPPAADKRFVALAERFGATAAESPYVDPDPGLAEVLVAGQQAGQAKLEELARGGRDAPGGWSSALHLFDYNLDHLGLGTIDAPDWKIPDRAKAYVTRAVTARAALWGNHGYEACYAFAWTDEDGHPIDRYSIGDRAPGLQTGRDGSVTIYLQTDSPGPARRPTGRPRRPVPSARSCACTSPSSRYLTGPTFSRQSGRSARAGGSRRPIPALGGR
jgi:hypothetical protein